MMEITNTMNTIMQHPKKTVLFFLFLSILSFWPINSHATFVSPKRVMIEDGQRVAVVIINNGKDETMVYSFSWEQRIQSPTGESILLKEGETAPGFMPASPILQFSPRRVVIGPKKSQKVRILVKRPSNLPKGEYHSHLLIKPIPLVDNKVAMEAGEGLSGIIKVRAKLSIPVFIRHGKTTLDIKLQEAYLHKVKGRATVHTNYINNSTRSVYLKPELLCYIAGEEEPIRTIIQTSKIYVEAKSIIRNTIVPKETDLSKCTAFKLELFSLNDFEYKNSPYISRDIIWR